MKEISQLLCNVDYELFAKISRDLESYHCVFYTFWQISHPNFSTKTQTAQVEFDRDNNCTDFIINSEYWGKCTYEKKLFIIMHECMHVVLNHGYRICNAKNIEAANIAADIVVNHSIVEHFGFDISKINDIQNMCFISTVFPGQNISQFESYEYYYNLIINNNDQKEHELLNDHSKLVPEIEETVSQLNNAISETSKRNLKPLINKHYTNNTTEQHIQNNHGYSIETIIGQWKFINGYYNKKKSKPKEKWESVIKKWTQKSLTQSQTEHWIRMNRQYSLCPSDIFLPSEMEDDNYEKNKIKVWFFLDLSGSCIDLADRFFHAAESLPTDKFDVELFCFDTKVYELDMKDKKVIGGGGTSFEVIEKYIQKQTNQQYPHAVFIITDGNGKSVFPQKPKNWYWFLTTNKFTNRIHKQSNCYILSDFE